MDLSFFCLISTMILLMEQEVSGSGSGPVVGSDLSVQLGDRVQRRVKRCSCENLKDKECVYFCHIGIVWVNTPSQIIPYGVGSLQMRVRREAVRCLCRNQRDTECLQFCSQWNVQDENASVLLYHPGKSKEPYRLPLKPKRKISTGKT